MSSIFSGTTRLTGLASGMDTESLVNSMMQIEQLKLNRELRSLTTTTWKQEALTGIKTDITDFKNTFMSALSPKNMLTSSAYVKFKLSTKYEGSAVTVAANSNNTASAVTIDWIQQIATADKAQSKLDAATGRGSVLKNDLAEGNYIALEDMEFTNALQFDEKGNVSFEINGETFTFNKSDTLQTVLSTVSNNEKAGVVLNFSRLTNSFTLTSKTMGSESELSFKNISGNVFGENGAFQIGDAQIQQGQNARLSINGVEIERSSNHFTIDGIVYTLNKATATTVDGSGKVQAAEDPIEFTIEKDVDSAVNMIKDFIEGYNTLIKKLETMIAERKSSTEKNYTALTDEEKSGMTEKQIEEWEAIAKKGLLYNDSDLRNMLTALRNAMYETVQGVGLSASQVGIKTGDYFSGKQGEIVLDEDALRAALNKDADQVMRAFMNISNAEDASTKYKESGFLYKVQSILDGYTKGSQANTLDTIGRNLRNLNSKISTMEEKMAKLEERYYMKFAAMETAMSKLQNQSNNLASLLGTNNK